MTAMLYGDTFDGDADEDTTEVVVAAAVADLRATFHEGRRSTRSLADAVARDDHLAHARAHLAALAGGDTSEDHAAHALARLALYAVRRRLARPRG